MSRHERSEAKDVHGGSSEQKLPPALGLDLDGTIDEAPTFFQFLARCWEGPVYVITYRDNLTHAEQDIRRFGVRFDRVILVDSFAEKARWIRELNIQVYFDDMDEVLQHIPDGVAVFKVRNMGNFDFDIKKWLYDHRTGHNLNDD